MADLPAKRRIGILNIVTFVAVVAIGIFLYVDNREKKTVKFKYEIISDFKKEYSVEPPALFGSNCLKFLDGNKKLVVVCGPVKVRQL